LAIGTAGLRPGAAAQGTIHLEGVQVEDIDHSVDPCQDFDAYANGKWRAEHPMPAIQTSWALRTIAQEDTLARLHTLAETAASLKVAKPGTTEQLVGDFYGACIDESHINALGLKPLEPMLAKIEGIKDRAGITTGIVELHRYGIAAPVSLSSSQDPHEPTTVIGDVDLGGLGLPDRDYYLRDEPRFKDVRDKYLLHVAAMFELAGYEFDAAKEAAAGVLRIETKLAEARLTRVEMRDPKQVDHPMSFAELQALTPAFDWPSAYRVLAVAEGKVNVDQLKEMKALNEALTTAPIADWKSYLKWHLLDSEGSALPVKFGDEQFAFSGRILTGAQEQRPRWQRCVRATDRELGEALGKMYVETYFPPEAKARARQMAVNIAAHLKLSIKTNDWMTPPTRAKALEKIDALNIKVGYPDKWKDYSSVHVTRGDYLSDLMSAQAFAVRDDLAQIGKPLNRGRWDMTPPTLNAYYNPQMNEIVVPAGYLQPPGFNPKGLDAINYGAIGVTMGHEISHGVDDEGAQFDALGKLTNWWTPEDYAKFQAKTACTAKQYDGYFIEPGIHTNGKLVLGEALGDLGEVNLAYRAYEKSREGKGPEPTVDGLTPEQQFFLAEAQWRGALVRPEALRLAVQTDPHPTGKFRVLGPLSNMPEFQKAFSCKEGSAMVRTGEDRCAVW
jgi:endothelin-converting enzyme/putative endopeptidase